MNFYKNLMLQLVVLLGITTAVFAAGDDGQDDSNYQQQLNDKDWEVLRDFVNSKRAIDGEGEPCSLTVSGDVRTEWRHLCEEQNGRILRGGKAKKRGIPLSRNDFDIEFNLRFDYVCDRAWMVAEVDFDNSAGVDRVDRGCPSDRSSWQGNGVCDSVCLKKAYAGYNLYTECGTRIDVEFGRRNLYNALDSRVQFLSRFDGILLKYSTNFENVADFYANFLGFVVDERVNHFAWATEIGFLDIYDKGVDLKYSFIDWVKNGRNRCGAMNPNGSKFRISQWSAIYHFEPELTLNLPAKLYGAFALNHTPPSLKGIRNVKKNPHGTQPQAWYVGFTIGQVVNENDWAFDVQYQWVGATSIPDEDVGGIGRGNVLDDNLTFNGRGNTNFKGWKFQFLYAITDNLTVEGSYSFSKQINKRIGGTHNFNKFEIETIFAF